MSTLALELKKIPEWVKDTGLVIGASFLIALFAYVSIPLPFTPIPLVAQASLILLLSVLLGSKRASAAVVLFLGQAACGLPVLSGGRGGFLCFFGPTVGYLIGYLVAAYAVGKIIEISSQKTLTKAFLAMLAGNAIIFLFGVSWLATIVGAQNAVLLGIVPFIFGDILKIALSLKILQWMGWGKS